MKKDNFIKHLKNSLGSKYVLTAEWEKHTFSKGWRYGEGEALAVVKPGTVIFEINGLDKEMSYKVLKTASYKLPIKTKIIEREIIRI